MSRRGKLSRQLKFGIIFVVTYVVLIAVLFVAAFRERGRGEQNAPAWILLIISCVVWYTLYLIGLGSVAGDGSTIFVGLFLTGLLVFGIGLLVGHIITIIVRHKAQNDLRP